MLVFALILLACYANNVVMAVLRKPTNNRDKEVVEPVTNADILDEAIIEAFRRRLYDQIEAVKWKAHFRLWADLGIDALSRPISILNEFVNSVELYPTYELWLVKLRKKLWDKGQEYMMVIFRKINYIFTLIHKYLRKKVDSINKDTPTDYRTKNYDNV